MKMAPHDAMEYFIQRTDQRLEAIESKLDALIQFKAEMATNARYVAFVVSGICGFISMVVSGVLTILLTTKLAR